MPERWSGDPDAQGRHEQGAGENLAGGFTGDVGDDIESLADDFAVTRIEGHPTGAAPDAEDDDPVPPATRVPSPFDVRLTPQRRAVAVGSAVAAVVLALVVILSTIPGAGPTLAATLGLAPPSPTPTLIPGADTVFFVDGVPWGTLTVDGHTAAVVSPGGMAYPQLQLARGTHTIVYTAVPFPKLRCWVSVPAATSDTCPVATGALNTIQTDSSAFRSIDLQATPDNLPSEQYAALVSAVQAAFAVPDGTVPVGDHFLAKGGTTAVATSPLTAHLLITLPEQGTVRGGINGATCDPLCANPMFGPGNLGRWQVAALGVPAWQFTTSDGQIIVGDSAPDDEEMLLMLDVDWSGTWSAATAIPDQLAMEVCSTVNARLGKLLPSLSNPGQSYSVETHTGPSVMDGCLVRVSPDVPVTSGTGPGDPPLTILYRFGALIAADAATAHALPQLPLASAAERTLAARLGASASDGSGQAGP